MDFLNKSLGQLKDLFRSMSPGSRVTTAVLLAAVVVSLVYLVRHETSGGGEYLMGGESFAPRDLHVMEAAFGKKQLSGYTVEGTKIRVPRGQQNAYMAALADENALPANFNDILQQAVDSGSNYESPERTKQRVEVAKRQALEMIIAQMQGIDSAAVIYDEKINSRGWQRETVRTASVNVQPSGSESLDDTRAAAIRGMVVKAYAGLKSEDVIVTDLSCGRPFVGGSADGVANPMDDGLLARKQFLEKWYKEKILEGLSYVPGAVVTCNVDLDPEKNRHTQEIKYDPKTVVTQAIKSTTTRNQQGATPGGAPGYRSQAVSNAATSLAGSQANGPSEEEQAIESHQANAVGSTHTESESADYPIRRVSVAVTVPESLFKKIWQDRNPSEPSADSNSAKTPDAAALAQIRSETESTIRSQVAAVLPTPSDGSSATDLVTVSVFPDIKPEPLPEPSMVETTLAWLANSWSTLGMIGLGLLSMLMLRSMVRAGLSPAPKQSAAVAGGEPDEVTPDVERPKAEPRRRFNTSGSSLKDELSDLVGSDPDTAANILRNWISSAS